MLGPNLLGAGVDDKAAALDLAQAFEGLAAQDGELLLVDDALPKIDELFLGVGRLAELAVERDLYGLSRDKLAARVPRDGAARASLLVNREEGETLPLGFE